MKLWGITYKSGGIRVPLPSTLILLLLLHSSSATALSTDPSAKIDSLQEVLGSMVEDTSRVALYVSISQEYQAIQVDSAFLYIRKALSLSQATDYSTGIARCWIELGRTEVRHGSSKQALTYFKKAVPFARRTPDLTLLWEAYQNVGDRYLRLEQYASALQYYQYSLATAEQMNDSISVAFVKLSIGATYFRTKNYDKAITIYEELLSIFPYEAAVSIQHSDKQFLLEATTNNLARVYHAKKNYLKALHYYQRSLQAARTDNNIQGEARTLNNIAVLYTSMKQYTKALSYAQQAQAIYQKVLKVAGDSHLEDTMGSIYVGLQQYERARVHFIKALSIMEKQDNMSGYASFYTNLIRLDSLTGNYQQAFLYQQRLSSIKDSLFDVDKIEAVEELKIQYETKQKDQAIALLQAQSDHQQLEARQQRFVKNSFIGGSMALVLLLGLGYNRYRFKQRALEIMRQQNEEIQVQKEQVERKNHENQLLLKEVHHRVKNNLQIVLSILNAQADSLHDAQTVAAIRESQHRVHSMALIHQSLYQSDDLSHIQARQYLQEMVETVCQSYRSEAKPVRLRLQVEDLAMNMSTAVPVGLIVTELVTNACKHALLEADSELSVTLRAETTTQYRLTVADNGPGLPPDFNVDQANSLGLQLVHGLTQQLNGELVVQNDTGACFELLFYKAA